MTLKEAEVVALSTLKQVMEEKVRQQTAGHVVAFMCARSQHFLQVWWCIGAWCYKEADMDARRQTSSGCSVSWLFHV